MAEVVPYVPSDQVIPEFTIKAVVFGVLLSMVMAAANAYIGLRVGLTVSAALPAAVISMGVFAGLRKMKLVKSATILENNVVKTMACAGESLAAGIIFTIPALLIVGAWETIDFVQTTTVALLGGMLGVLFTIALRRILVEELDLPFPEGVAASEVLIAGEEGGAGLKYVAGGLVSAMLFAGTTKVATHQGIKWHGLWPGTIEGVHTNGNLSLYGGADLSTALLGVGYIVGPNVSSKIFIGGVIGWLILAPLFIFMNGQPPGTYLVDGAPLTDTMDVYKFVATTQVRFVGVGAMIVGGLYALVAMRKPITKGMKEAFRKHDDGEVVSRVQQDIPMNITFAAIGFIGILLIGFYYQVTNVLGLAVITAVILLVFAFLFTAIAGYLAGLLGSSNNPISGVTVATLLFVSLLLVGLSAIGIGGKDVGVMAAIILASVVCCSAAIAGDVMQSLKTGQLLGSTPRNLQLAEFFGVAAAALVIAPVIALLHNTYGIGEGLPAPQAILMAKVTEGVFMGTLNWPMVYLGMLIALLLIVLDKPVLSIAVGIYLPFSLTIPILLGGIVNYFVNGSATATWHWKREQGDDPGELEGYKEKVGQKGILFSSGLVAGEALMGILLAIFIAMELDLGSPFESAFMGVIILSGFVLSLLYMGMKDALEDDFRSNALPLFLSLSQQWARDMGQYFREVWWDLRDTLMWVLHGFRHREYSDDEE